VEDGPDIRREIRPGIWHASCVAFADGGVLIMGASGAGKSGLALQLMALGAVLVADDRVIVTEREGAVRASCPDTIRGRIEARFVGILNAETQAEARIVLAVDLDQRETMRLPPRRSVRINQYDIPLLYGSENLHLAAAIAQMVRAGRSDPA